MQQRPMSVTIFGILNIGFAVLGIVGLFLSMAVLSHVGEGNPMLRQMYSDPHYVAWMKISLPLGGLAATALLASGIGLLFVQNWARILSIVYSVYAVFSGIIGGLMMVHIFMGAAQQNATLSGPMKMIPLISSLVGMVLGLVYPILLGIFMTRPNVIAACRPWLPPAEVTPNPP